MLRRYLSRVEYLQIEHCENRKLDKPTLDTLVLKLQRISNDLQSSVDGVFSPEVEFVESKISKLLMLMKHITDDSTPNEPGRFGRGTAPAQLWSAPVDSMSEEAAHAELSADAKDDLDKLFERLCLAVSWSSVADDLRSYLSGVPEARQRELEAYAVKISGTDYESSSLMHHLENQFCLLSRG